MSYPIVFYRSDMEGASVMNGQVGSMLSVLRSFLLTGFNVKSVQSITRSSNTATVTINAGHAFKVNDILEISGATQSEYNGRQRVLSVPSATTLTYSVSGTPTTPATGVITAKYPSLDWVEAKTLTNEAWFRSQDQQSTQILLAVNDADWRRTDVRMYETTAGLNTPPPYTKWYKSQTNDATARKWWAIGDSKRFYLFVASSANYPTVPSGYFFGDITNWKSGDAYHCGLIGRCSTNTDDNYNSTYPAYNSRFGYCDGNNFDQFLTRSYHQLGRFVNFGKYSVGRGQMGYDGTPFPNPANNGLHIVPVYVIENNSWRGQMPGMYQSLEATGAIFASGDRSIRFPVGFSDKEFMGQAYAAETAYQNGYVWFDITGPW